MARRPNTSLDALAMPKGAEVAPAAAEAPAPVPAAPAAKNYAHTLSLRLTAEQYRRLRRYVARVEEEGRVRVTHQAIIETALADFLEQQGEPNV